MPRRNLSRRHAATPIVAGLQGRRLEHTAEHGTVDVSPFAGLFRLAQSDGDTKGGIGTGKHVAHRHAALYGRSPFLAGHAHHAADCLNRDIEGAARGIGAALPIARNRAINEPRILLGHRLVAETETTHHARPIVLKHDMGAADQRLSPADIHGILQVQYNASFVAIQ